MFNYDSVSILKRLIRHSERSEEYLINKIPGIVVSGALA